MDPLLVNIPYYRQVTGYVLEQDSSFTCRLAKYTRFGDYKVIAVYDSPKTQEELDSMIVDIRNKYWKKRLFNSVRVPTAEELQAMRDEIEYEDLLEREAQEKEK